MNNEDAIRKIKAALALAASSNEHEAAAAARQAQALMDKYKIEEGDLRIAEVEEKRVKAGAKQRPVAWENHLAHTCADAFGCELIFSSGWAEGEWLFIGVNPAGQLSQYAFEVLFRACKKARRDYMEAALKRYKSTKNKIAKADLYAQGWVMAVAKNLIPTAPTLTQRQTIQEYLDKKYSKIEKLEARQNSGSNRADDWKHSAQGREAGKGVVLSKGVATGGKPKQLTHG